MASAVETGITSSKSSRVRSGGQADAAALDSVRAGLAARDDRRLGRLDDHPVDVGDRPAQGARDAEEAAGRADVGAERVDAPVQLVEQLPAQLGIALDHVAVVELICGETVNFVHDLGGAAHHARDEITCDPLRARDDLELGTERAHGAELLRREGIGGDDSELVTLHSTDEGKRRPGAAARVLHDGLARLQAAAALGSFDHRERHAVLVGAGGVCVLELDPDLGDVGPREPLEPDDGGAPDCAEHRRPVSRRRHAPRLAEQERGGKGLNTLCECPRARESSRSAAWARSART